MPCSEVDRFRVPVSAQSVPPFVRCAHPGNDAAAPAPECRHGASNQSGFELLGRRFENFAREFLVVHCPRH